jgi:quinol monooxygenase YgiN
MITLIARVTAAEGKADELRAALLEMVESVKKNEAGNCLAYSLHTTEDPNIFVFYEQYGSQEALEAHRTTDHMGALNQKIKEGRLTGARLTVERLTQIAGIK